MTIKDVRLSTTTLVVTADETSALLGSSTLLAWCCSLTGEGLQKGLCPFEFPLSFPVPPALLLCHQLHYLQDQHRSKLDTMLLHKSSVINHLPYAEKQDA